MSVPSVHIILLNWNGLADTLACLDSLKAQDYPALKIWVVDNGSAEVEAATIEREHAEVAVLRQHENLGFCGGNNVGIRRALDDGADFVLILNNDTIAPPRLISELVAQSARLKDVGAVSPVILRHPGDELIWYAGAVWESATAGFRHVLDGRPRAELRASDPYPTVYACGCCLLVSATVLRRVGLMDERYFAYYDEADWCSRMKEAGLDCYVIPTATLAHKVSRSTPNLVATYLMARNRLLWMKEHLSLRVRWSSYPYLLKEFVWNIFNLRGRYLNKQHISARHSKVMLIAWRDFLGRRFGAWPQSVAQLTGEAQKPRRQAT